MSCLDVTKNVRSTEKDKRIKKADHTRHTLRCKSGTPACSERYKRNKKDHALRRNSAIFLHVLSAVSHDSQERLTFSIFASHWRNWENNKGKKKILIWKWTLPSGISRGKSCLFWVRDTCFQRKNKTKRSDRKKKSVGGITRARFRHRRERFKQSW